MKYNEKYDRWVTKGGLVYRYSKSKDKLILCKQSLSCGYLTIRLSKPKLGSIKVHRLIWETFNGEIPQGYEIDHEDTHKDNNALSNLKLCTHKENCNNPLTLKNKSEANKGKTFSEFGIKFKEHYGITRYKNIKLYKREYMWYSNHNKKCRWEVEK